jgi:uncharacterized membrane protein
MMVDVVNNLSKLSDYRHSLGGIIAVGVILRIFRYDSRPLYIDERVGTYKYSSIDPIQLFFSSPYPDTHPPLYYWFIHYWRDIFGDSITSVRFPSIIFGTIAVVGVYLLCRHISSHKTGIIGASLLAISPYHISVSQYAREYALFTAAIIFSFYFLLQLFSQRSKSISIGYVFSTAIMSSIHIYGPFLVIGQWIFLYISSKKNMFPSNSILSVIKLQVIAAAIVSPVLFTSARMTYYSATVPGSLGQNNLPTPRVILRVFGTYFGGRYSIPIAAIALLITSLLISLYILNIKSMSINSRYLPFEESTPDKEILYLGCWGLPTILLPVFISYTITVIWDGRSTIGAFLVAIVAIALAIERLRSNILEQVVFFAIMTLNCVILYIYYNCHTVTGTFFCH